MRKLCERVLAALAGRTLVTAESLTGGGIGAALTAVPGSSEVYKGGVISYTDWVKAQILDVPQDILEKYGAVSAPVAQAMAQGVRKRLQADVAVSVTGLAGPGGDNFGHPVGTVFIGLSDEGGTQVRECHFSGDREAVRSQTVEAALEMILLREENPLEPMAAFFERRLEGYDDHMLETIVGAKEFYPFTAAQLPDWAGCAVLDLGCGTGLELEEYFARNPSASVTGIDLSEGMLSALKRKFLDRELHLIQGSYFEVPFGEEVFDAAVSVESLHHFTAQQKLALYRKLWQSLRPGGYFVLTDYFAESEDKEREYFENLGQRKKAQGIPEAEFYHYDTPLTVEHEIKTLHKAGFTRCEILNRWEATCTVKAVK